MTLLEFLSSVKIARCDIYVIASWDIDPAVSLREGKYIRIGDDLYNNCETEEDVYDYLNLPKEFEPWLYREILEVQCDYNRADIRRWVDRGYSNYSPTPAFIIFIEEEPSDDDLWNDDNLEEKIVYGYDWPFVPNDGWDFNKEDWPYKLPYEMFEKANEIINDDLFLGLNIISNIALQGFDWAKNMTDEDIEKERERDKQKDAEIEKENEELKKKGIKQTVFRTDSGLSVAIMGGARELADVLETYQNWIFYLLISNDIRRCYIKEKNK